ncbi:MAG: FlgD immunoglobulin-like domain containing protein [Candidatus Eisenbacteria bacterium]
MKRMMIVLVALTLAAVAVAGQNPNVRLYIDFDPPNYVHELRAPAVGDTIRLYVVADSLGSDPGDGLWGAAFRVTRDFGGTYLGTVNLLDPATAPIGDPESVEGIALASGGNCIEGSVVPIAELTYLYGGTPGTISLLPHSSDGAVTADCNNDLDTWSLHSGGTVVLETEEPLITGVTDVGNDQGRRIRLEWARSVYDAAGRQPETITGYGVYRRQDEYRTEGLPQVDASYAMDAAGARARLSGWDYVLTVPARGDSAYQCVAPTLCDSTELSGICWSVFMVSAMTESPLVYYDSSPDSGYSVDNLEPAPPEPLRGDFDPGSGHIALSWPRSTALDFAYFEVHRDMGDQFEPDVGNFLGAITDTAFADASLTWTPEMCYKVTAVDFSGNRSEYATVCLSETGVEATGGAATLSVQNAPNPFNPAAGRTEISFALANPGGRVEIAVYDLAGHLVRELLDAAMPSGVHTVSWDGMDSRGHAVRSGVYFYRVDALGVVEQRKLVVIR